MGHAFVSMTQISGDTKKLGADVLGEGSFIKEANALESQYIGVKDIGGRCTGAYTLSP